MIAVGDRVRITKRGHWACGRVVVMTGLPRLEIQPDFVFQAGSLVEYEATDHWGQPCRHVVGVEEVEPAPAARVYRFPAAAE